MSLFRWRKSIDPLSDDSVQRALCAYGPDEVGGSCLTCEMHPSWKPVEVHEMLMRHFEQMSKLSSGQLYDGKYNPIRVLGMRMHTPDQTEVRFGYHAFDAAIAKPNFAVLYANSRGIVIAPRPDDLYDLIFSQVILGVKGWDQDGQYSAIYERFERIRVTPEQQFFLNESV